ncbi:MAG: DUF975 family protein [Treponema sp.]|nr:DUF975 family protein [Treponema sp.]
MFDRVAYKKAAKAQLSGRWKVPVLSTLLLSAIVMIFVIAMGLIFPDQVHVDFSAGAGSLNYGVHGDSAPTIFSIFICAVAVVFIFAQKVLFERMSKDPEPVLFGDVLEGVGSWFMAVRGFLWFLLWVWLWSLLFVIPGIVKRYSYSMMFYIMAENPNVGVCKAMKISKELTRGYKGDLFFTDLTFIPLYLLCGLSMGIGFLWFSPYYQATYTKIYHALKEQALNTQRIKIEDFE